MGPWLVIDAAWQILASHNRLAFAGSRTGATEQSTEGRRQRHARWCGAPHQGRIRSTRLHARAVRRWDDSRTRFSSVRIRAGKSGSSSRLLRLIGTGEGEIRLKLRDDVEDAPDLSGIGQRFLLIDAPGHKIFDDGGQFFVLRNDSSVAAFCAQTYCDDTAQARTAAGSIRRCRFLV
jgi:hypothetical protein